MFISSTASTENGEEVCIGLDSAPPGEHLLVHQTMAPSTLEAMRYLPAGEHRLRLQVKGSPALETLIIRAIPELIFCKFQYDPHIPEYGPYDWDFLDRDSLGLWI